MKKMWWGRCGGEDVVGKMWWGRCGGERCIPCHVVVEDINFNKKGVSLFKFPVDSELGRCKYREQGISVKVPVSIQPYVVSISLKNA